MRRYLKVLIPCILVVYLSFLLAFEVKELFSMDLKTENYMKVYKMQVSVGLTIVAIMFNVLFLYVLRINK